ncbi:MAG: hypothetical protein HYV94_17915 [Candidatus Rokubacteria bacterium]|nr:hypothetical protein [Candidatus Rokubacteria bacterium]MBI2493958.1 hypothetical protein [Candidatus Rokubacteria bacterium]
MSRFFVEIIKRVSEKEDVFTECLAASLREDRDLARRFLLKLCGDRLDGVDVRTAAIDVATQCSFRVGADAPACCVDMVLTLAATTKIGVENKLFAAEGRDQAGNRDQLRTYLRLGLSRIAYIRAQEADVADDVRHNARYLTPADRQHFLWSDFYLDVEACARQGSLLTTALLELFLHYGFEPAKREIGDLRHPDKTVAEANRQNFAKLWEITKAELSKLGWKRIGSGSIAELYVDEGSSELIKKAWIDPTWARGLLRVRLTPHAGNEAKVEEALQGAVLPHHGDVEIQRGRAAGRVRDPQYVQVTISLRKLLGETTEVQIMKKLLAEFVSEVFRAAK